MPSECDDHFNDECGVFGVWNGENAGYNTVLGLHALQHRGQESGGIVTYDRVSKTSNVIKRNGVINSSFSQADIDSLCGKFAIGHVRYSTSGGKDGDDGIQPFVLNSGEQIIAVAHNGNFTNSTEVRGELIASGAEFSTEIDTENLIHLIARHGSDKAGIVQAALKLQGAFSILVMTKDFICAFRDPSGIRPLSIGKIGEAVVFASETCAFSICGAEFVRDVLPGEVVFISNSGIESSFPFQKMEPKFCIFEYVYFARPDSIVEGRNVYNVRKKIGQQLAIESKIDADVVVPVPDSGVPAAIGFSNESGIPMELGIVRSHYVGRTFIDPTQQARSNKVLMKHSPNAAIVEGKRVVLIDDSIVRGTTSKKIVKMLKDAGAKEVHMRISSPPTKFSCFYGIDTPNSSDLIANNHSVEEIRKYLGADSLSYLSTEGLYKAVRGDEKQTGFCNACFTGDYFL